MRGGGYPRIQQRTLNEWGTRFCGDAVGFALCAKVKRIPCGNERQEKQEQGQRQKQIPCGDDRKKSKSKYKKEKQEQVQRRLHQELMLTPLLLLIPGLRSETWGTQIVVIYSGC